MSAKIQWNHPKYGTTIALGAETEYPFSFGLKKAKLILSHLKDIESFVEQVESAERGANGARQPVAVTSTGAIMKSKHGRCEDAPCCGCCPA